MAAAILTVTIDSTSGGSDTAASGAGPATPVIGTGASTTAASAVADLSADTPDLSGVAADDVLWIDSSSGRQFNKVVSVDDGADTVTCEDNWANTEGSRNWGIGGKRANLSNANTAKVFADAHAGWVIDILQGTDYSITTALACSATGSGVSGENQITVTSSSGTRPIITSATDDVTLFSVTGVGWKFENFNLTHTATNRGDGFVHNERGLTIVNCIIDGCLQGIDSASGQLTLIDTEIKNSVGDGIDATSFNVHTVIGCYIHDNGGHGIEVVSDAHYFCIATIFDTNTGDGIRVSNGGDRIALICYGCVFYNNTGDGIEIASNASVSKVLSLVNNIFDSNGGFGVNVDLDATYTIAANRHNAYRNNTSNPRSSNMSAGEGDVILIGNSPFTDAANGDFTLNNTSGEGADLREAGFPDTIPGVTGTSFPDIGTMTHQDPAGGGGLLVHPDMAGGMRG